MLHVSRLSLCRKPVFQSASSNWKAAGLTLLTCGVAYVSAKLYGRRGPSSIAVTSQESIGKPKLGGRWSLVDSVSGLPVSSDSFKGRYALLYFGFTFCPDICPQEMDKIVEVLRILKDKGFDSRSLQPIFITVDPRRDTCAQIGSFLKGYPIYRGFTGTPEAIKKVSRMFRVYYNDGIKTTDEDYLVDHSSKLKCL